MIHSIGNYFFVAYLGVRYGYEGMAEYRYGAVEQAEGSSDEGSEAAREGHGFSGISDRPFYRADQAPHPPPEEE